LRLNQGREDSVNRRLVDDLVIGPQPASLTNL